MRTIDYLLLTLLLIVASARGGAALDASTDEVYRIRIENVSGGLVQLSLDQGETYGTVGRVVRPATARIAGFGAASYISGSTVAATAVHGLRIKTGQGALGIEMAQIPLMFSINPIEFRQTPGGFGGLEARCSGIYTDIYSGHSIFRNESPYAGSPVCLERDHELRPLPEDYTPIEGETFVIVVNRPREAPTEIDFDNRAGGKVIALYQGGSSQTVAEVVRPVTGVGRYDGTSFTGVGAVNTNHGGVLTISTAPTCLPGTREGGPVETRGGFMVQPWYHVAAQSEGETGSQVMVVRPVSKSGRPIRPGDKPTPGLEGTPPLFDGCINLSRYYGHPANSFRAQVKIDDGPWEDMPRIVGRVDNAFRPEYLGSYFSAAGSPRSVTKGLTAIRLLFPEYDSKLLAADLAREVADYSQRAVKSAASVVRGTIEVGPKPPHRGARMVEFFLDGKITHISNVYPFDFAWDSTSAVKGYHSLEVETILDSSPAPIAEKRLVFVGN